MLHCCAGNKVNGGECSIDTAPRRPAFFKGKLDLPEKGERVNDGASEGQSGAADQRASLG